jgi:glycerophosphoryl diester phosphodiesterase
MVIAHRGASGYLPEHTLEAYAAAHAMGAHYIEPDLVLTKDKVFICLHDIHLESTTNVEQVFPDRHRDDGKWYAADFTLAEIKQLQAEERVQKRFPQGVAGFEVPTFVEMVALVQGMNTSTGRVAGIYPELKNPAWHTRAGLPMEEAFLAELAKLGYEGPDAKIFVQCFEGEPLKKLRELGCTVPMIHVLGSTQKNLLTEEGLKEVANYAQGVGPDMRMLLADPEIVTRAHALGLEVHPYTLRADMLPPVFENFTALLDRFYGEYKIDGAFSDHPDLVVQYLEEMGK